MSEFSWEPHKKKEDKRGLLGLLALIPRAWRLLAFFVALAAPFMGALFVLFREEGSNRYDASRLEAVKSFRRVSGRAELPPTPSATQSPLPLPGILKQELKRTDENFDPKSEAKIAGKAEGEKGGAIEDEEQTAADGGASGSGRVSPLGQGGAAGTSGGGPRRKGWDWSKRDVGKHDSSKGHAQKTGSSKRRGVESRGGGVMSGTYTSTRGYRTCQGNIHDLPELQPLVNQLKSKRAFLQENGCGAATCRACSDTSRSCACASTRCDADKLYYRINSQLCGASSAE